MREIVIVSGKGGTGKTSIVASFAALAEKSALADCDVDAADLYLVLEPHIQKEHEFKAGNEARINPASCVECGRCREVCRFDAIDENYVVDGISCEGCGVCVEFCPADAIEFPERMCGEWFLSETRFGPMVHARLGVAAENSGKLVTLVKKKAREIAKQKQLDYVLVDGPPGIGCPVIASITGADIVVIVTEPTMSGKHDMERVAGVAKLFGIPTVVCINKADLNEKQTAAITAESEALGLAVVGSVRYDDAVTKAQIKRRAVVEEGDTPVAGDITSCWQAVVRALRKGNGQ